LLLGRRLSAVTRKGARKRWRVPGPLPNGRKEADGMLKWALIFFLISLVAGFFGFTNVAAGARTIARILFFIAIAILLVFLVLAFTAGSLVI
jgi:uncharacterized membrane protein YtjA (UPF0391 family)